MRIRSCMDGWLELFIGRSKLAGPILAARGRARTQRKEPDIGSWIQAAKEKPLWPQPEAIVANAPMAKADAKTDRPTLHGFIGETMQHRLGTRASETKTSKDMAHGRVVMVNHLVPEHVKVKARSNGLSLSASCPTEAIIATLPFQGEVFGRLQRLKSAEIKQRHSQHHDGPSK